MKKSGRFKMKILLFPFLIIISCGITEIEEYSHVTVINEIHLISANGQQSQLLTHGKSPVFTLDRSSIAFISPSTDGGKIMTLNLSGYDSTSVTNFHRNLDNISQSPKHDQIVFNSESFTTLSQDIFIINLDGSSQFNITNTSDYHEYSPSFSQDGNKICFIRFNYQDLNYYLVNIDLASYQEVKYYKHPDNLRSPRFALNDSIIVFSNKVLKIMDTANPSHLEVFEDIPETSMVSQNGMVIYNKNRRIYCFDLVARVTFDLGVGEAVAVSPDGKKVIYTVRNNNNNELFIMDINGSNIVLLSSDLWGNSQSYYEYYPNFSNDNSMIVLGISYNYEEYRY